MRVSRWKLTRPWDGKLTRPTDRKSKIPSLNISDSASGDFIEILADVSSLKSSLMPIANLKPDSPSTSDCSTESQYSSTTWNSPKLLPVIHPNPVKKVSTVGDKLTCPVCRKHFSKPYNVQRHMKIHTGEKRFKCDYCPKRFVQKANLRQHLRVHTGEKPFSCKICGRRFAQESSLGRHSRAHLKSDSFENRLHRPRRRK